MGGAWTCGGKFCPCWHPSFLWRCSGQRSCMLCRNGAATVKRPPAPSAFCASRANCLCFSFRRQFAQQASSRPNCVGALQLCCLFTVRGFHNCSRYLERCCACVPPSGDRVETAWLSSSLHTIIVAVRSTSSSIWLCETEKVAQCWKSKRHG